MVQVLESSTQRNFGLNTKGIQVDRFDDSQWTALCLLTCRSEVLQQQSSNVGVQPIIDRQDKISNKEFGAKHLGQIASVQGTQISVKQGAYETKFHDNLIGEFAHEKSTVPGNNVNVQSAVLFGTASNKRQVDSFYNLVKAREGVPCMYQEFMGAVTEKGTSSGVYKTMSSHYNSQIVVVQVSSVIELLISKRFLSKLLIVEEASVILGSFPTSKLLIEIIFKEKLQYYSYIFVMPKGIELELLQTATYSLTLTDLEHFGADCSCYTHLSAFSGLVSNQMLKKKARANMERSLGDQGNHDVNNLKKGEQ
ncbi:hypothetical protein KI387_019303, partial [Taxus chinensis]